MQSNIQVLNQNEINVISGGGALAALLKVLLKMALEECEDFIYSYLNNHGWIYKILSDVSPK